LTRDGGRWGNIDFVSELLVDFGADRADRPRVAPRVDVGGCDVRVVEVVRDVGV
jgi:hypothetical protein